MLLVVAVVVSIAAVDSLNPSTVLPALVYALGRNGVRDVAVFTAGVFSVSAAGGLVLVFGPGRALLTVVSHPSERLVHLAEALAGVGLIGAAVFLWLTRANVREHLERERESSSNSAFLVGAGIMAVELPTAVPYFGALIAITEADKGIVVSALLVLLFNLVFVAPLLAVLAMLLVTGERGAAIAARLRRHLIAYAPVLLPLLLGGLGLALLLAAVL